MSLEQQLVGSGPIPYNNMHVLIIGAGPGGLTVAQCLRKEGFPLRSSTAMQARMRDSRVELLAYTRKKLYFLRAKCNYRFNLTPEIVSLMILSPPS
jgi:hypothetical protein